MGSLASQGDEALARQAANGNPVAREAISRLAHPLIQKQTERFCKRFCYNNHFHFRCPLFPDWGLKEKDAPLCDWGNHSYTWMLEDLTGPERLKTFSGERLSSYFHAIVHSLPFYERWKDSRFGRRVRIPPYIQCIAPLAGKIFLWMVDQQSVGWMAQQTHLAYEKVEAIAGHIIDELTERGKLYLLNSPRATSLTVEEEEGEDCQRDLPDSSWDPAEEEAARKMREGRKQLTAIENFVLDKMVGEDCSAAVILAALARVGISIKEGVLPEKTNEQQLHYFKRRALAKLARVSGLS